MRVSGGGATLVYSRTTAPFELRIEIVTGPAGEEIYVEVLGDGNPAVEERVVTLGIVDGSRVQVLAGLAEGDEVRLK